jgi:hypothetical protein
MSVKKGSTDGVLSECKHTHRSVRQGFRRLGPYTLLQEVQPFFTLSVRHSRPGSSTGKLQRESS